MLNEELYEEILHIWVEEMQKQVEIHKEADLPEISEYFRGQSEAFKKAIEILHNPDMRS